MYSLIMAVELITTKITKEALANLKALVAIVGGLQYQVLADVIADAKENAERVQSEIARRKKRLQVRNHTQK